jgi:hypothetical protein
MQSARPTAVGITGALKCVGGLRFETSGLISRFSVLGLSSQFPIPPAPHGGLRVSEDHYIGSAAEGSATVPSRTRWALGVHTATVKSTLERHHQSLGSPSVPRIIIPRIYGSVLLVAGSPHGCMGRSCMGMLTAGRTGALPPR